MIGFQVIKTVHNVSRINLSFRGFFNFLNVGAEFYWFQNWNRLIIWVWMFKENSQTENLFQITLSWSFLRKHVAPFFGTKSYFYFCFLCKSWWYTMYVWPLTKRLLTMLKRNKDKSFSEPNLLVSIYKYRLMCS